MGWELSWEMIATLAVLAGAVVLFASERLRVDLVALLAMAVLMVLGIVSPEQGLAGFSNRATVTVAAMFVLSAGLIRTGAVNRLGDLVGRLLRRRFSLAVGSLMLIIAPLSAFINNTAAVAIFVPVVLAATRESEISASKLLIPLSFAAMFGGVCTLIGTSTNLLVSSIATDAGQEPFGMFEMAPLGLVLFVVGFLYMLTVGVRLLPARRAAGDDLTESFGLGAYLTEVEVQPGSDSEGVALDASPLVRELELEVMQLERDGDERDLPADDTVIRAGDVLLVRGDAERIRELARASGVTLKPRRRWRDEMIESDEVILAEAVVLPNSRLDGSSLARTRFRDVFGATVLALRHRGETVHQDLAHLQLSAGDTLLVELPREREDQLRQKPDFAVVSQTELSEFREDRMVLALGTIVAVVTAAVAGWLPISVAAPAGAVFLVLARVLTLEEAYKALEWKVLFLLAGVLALGAALEETGTARMLADLVIRSTGDLGPWAVVGAFYVLTSLLTESMSNNASAAVLAPVAIAAADTLGVDARPLLMAVTFAASASFMTPMGYQTNLLVYGPGQYRFTDFFRVGAPLNLLFWLLATLLIPRLWPL